MGAALGPTDNPSSQMTNPCCCSRISFFIFSVYINLINQNFNLSQRGDIHHVLCNSKCTNSFFFFMAVFIITYMKNLFINIY